MPRKPYKWLNIPKRKFPHPGDNETYDYDVQKTFNGIKRVTRSWVKKVAIKVDRRREERLVDIRDLEEYELIKRGQLKTLYDKIEYYPELGEHICREISEGKQLKEICVLDGMPGIPTVRKWERENKEFRDMMNIAMLTAAKEDVAELKMLSKKLLLMMEGATEKEAKLLQAASSAIREVSANLKWTISKEDPDTYGDKIEIKDERPIYNLLIQGRNSGQSQPLINVTQPPPLPDVVIKAQENRALIIEDNRKESERQLSPELKAKLEKMPRLGVKENE